MLLYSFTYSVELTLAIACGLVVDDAIVALENIIRYLEGRGRPKTCAIYGASKVGMAMTASTMTVVVVFIPLMFVGEITGALFKELGFVMVVTLFASLFTALSMTPMLSAKWLETGSKESAEKQSFWSKFSKTAEKFLVLIEDVSSHLLAQALAHKKIVIIGSILIFVSSLALVPFMGSSFIPDMDSGNVNVEFRLPEGTRIEETNQVKPSYGKNIANHW